MNNTPATAGASVLSGCRPAVTWPMIALVAGLSIAFWCVPLFNAARRFTPGFEFGEGPDGKIVAAGENQEASVKRGDRIMALGAVPVVRARTARPGEIDSIELSRRIHLDKTPGPMTLTIERAGKSLRVPISRLPALSRAKVVTSFFVFSVYLGTALLLARARTSDPAPRRLLFLLPLLGATHAADWLYTALIPFDALSVMDAFLAQGIPAAAPGFILWFLAVFPSSVRLPRWGNAAILFLFSLLPFAWACHDAVNPGFPAFLWSGPRTIVSDMTVIAANIVAVIRLVLAALRAEDEIVRQRSRLVFFPTALWVFVLILVNNLGVLRFGESVVPKLMTAAGAVIFPLSLMAAILKTRLFEIDRLIRRGAAYIAVTAILGTVFALAAPLLAATAANLFPESRGARQLASSILAALLVAVLGPLRRALQKPINRYFYRRHADPLDVLTTALGSDVTSSVQRNQQELVSRVDGLLYPERQWLWVAGRVHSPGPRGEEPHPDATRPLNLDVATATLPREGAEIDPEEVRAYLRRQAPSVSEAFHVARMPGIEPARERLARSGFDILFALTGTGGAILGFWALGPKRSEEPYSKREIEALGMAAHAFSLQLERDRLASQVEMERLGRQRAASRLARSREAGFAECPRCGCCTDEEQLCPEDGERTVSVQACPRFLASRYRLDRRIGAGGMGAVYKGWDTSLRRSVAVKLVHEEVGLEETGRIRFQREAHLAAKLSHPNAVAMFDTGELDGGTLFHVMELVEGGSLQGEISRRGRIPFPEGREYIDEMLCALAAAHDLGLIHRDIKPANVLLTANQPGRGPLIKVADFGLARGPAAEYLSGEKKDITHSGVVVGSLGYIAPEVLAGTPAGPASDIWAAAVTAYEVLTGVKAVRGMTLVETYEAARSEAYTPLRILAPEVPPLYAEAIRRGMSNDVISRPASAARFRALLENR